MEFGINGDGGGPLQWFFEIPPVSRFYLVGTLTTTTLTTLHVVSPYTVYFNWHDIIHGEVWRIVTNFLFFGEHFTMDLVFHIFFLVRYCRLLEEGEFRRSTADFIVFIIFGAILMIIVAPLIPLIFLGSSLTFMMVYVWGRRNSHVQMSLLGLIMFSAPYLPWILLWISMLLNNRNTMSADLVGMGAGHLYYFLAYVYPKVADIRGWKIRRIIFTPIWLKALCAEIETEDEREHVVLVTDPFRGLDGGVGEMGIPQAPNTNDEHEPLLSERVAEPAAAVEEEEEEEKKEE